jgi:hypothetical protein
MTIQKITNLLAHVPAGVVPTSVHVELFRLVEASWREFSNSADTSMEAWKIMRENGPEAVTWSPPHLSFTVDRHGAAVIGSTRAERQEWRLNLEMRTADQTRIGFRQLRPNAPRLDVKSLADDVAKTVHEGPSSTSPLVSKGIVVWKNDDELVVFHGKMVGGTNNQTISGRRRRFIAELKSKLQMIGWQFVSVRRGLTYKKTKI